jgi:hypothetical protein
VLYLKHLLRGVKSTKFYEAAAMQKFQKWHEEHEAHKLNAVAMSTENQGFAVARTCC